MLKFLKANGTNPFIQVAGILVLMIFLMIIGIATSGSEISVNPTGAWEVMAACVLFYTLVNCVFSLQSKDIMTYFRNSILSFIALLGIGGFMAYGFSGLAIDEAGSIKWILMVFCIGYLVFLSIVNLMKFIVDLAQKQDSRLRGEDPS